MIYGSGTWAVKKEEVRYTYLNMLGRTKKMMVEWMLDASLNGGITMKMMNLKMEWGLGYISNVLRRGRVRWLGKCRGCSNVTGHIRY